MDQLIRETQPPAGTLRSPVPQYWNPDTEKYERVLGVHGAPRAMLYGPNGQPISTSNRLPVDVGAQVATESTLAEAVSRLNAILTRLEGTLDVDVGGQIHADVDLGDVTVQIGEVQQGKRGQNAEPWEVTLSGQVRRSNTQHWIGTIPIGTSEVLFDTQGEIVIHDLILAFSNKGSNLYYRMSIGGSSYVYPSVDAGNLFNTWRLTKNRLESSGGRPSGLIRITFERDGWYSMGLASLPIRIKQFRLEVFNDTDADQNYYVQLTYSVV